MYIETQVSLRKIKIERSSNQVTWFYRKENQDRGFISIDQELLEIQVQVIEYHLYMPTSITFKELIWVLCKMHWESLGQIIIN